MNDKELLEFDEYLKNKIDLISKKLEQTKRLFKK